MMHTRTIQIGRCCQCGTDVRGETICTRCRDSNLIAVKGSAEQWAHHRQLKKKRRRLRYRVASSRRARRKAA